MLLSEALECALLMLSSPQIDVVSWMTRLAMEIIGQSGLGYTFDDLAENGVQHQYVIVSKRLV